MTIDELATLLEGCDFRAEVRVWLGGTPPRDVPIVGTSASDMFASPDYESPAVLWLVLGEGEPLDLGRPRLRQRLTNGSAS